jgi:hypothetical protein
MPVVYKIDRVNQIIRTKCIGPVTIEEVVDHFRTLEHDPNCPDYLDVLLDVSEETTIPTKEELEEVTRAVHNVRGRVRFGACAIVAFQDALFGMLRMWEVFAEQYFRETYVFRTSEEAEAWLASRQRNSSSRCQDQTVWAVRGD